MRAITPREKAGRTRMTDQELLLDVSLGDEAAFVELYQRHRDAVFRFAFRMLSSVELAEDVAHDCFLSLIQHPCRFDPARASLRTYLFSAARNLAMKHFRRNGHDVSLDDLIDESFIAKIDQPLVQLLDEEGALIVQRAVARLPPMQREALILFEYEEMRLEEIAHIVSADVGTVKARLYRARQALKRSLAGYFSNEPVPMALEEVCK